MSKSVRGAPMSWSPLPRVSPELSKTDGGEKYEVIIVGAGPAGLLLEYLLARYGLKDESLLCIDDKSHRVEHGHADGLQPRTLEVLKSLGLADRILQDGRHLWEFAVWEAPGEGPIQRCFITSTRTSAARYNQVVTIHQGIVESELENGLLQYSEKGIERNYRLVDVNLDEYGDPEFPVVAKIDVNGVIKTKRTKFLVATDGAHSTVRKRMGVHMQGETREDIWGVIDLIVDTDFPDIQRRCFIQSHAGSILVIPREQTKPGVYMTRLYMEMKPHMRQRTHGHCTAGQKPQDIVSMDDILQRAAEAFQPYYFRPKGQAAVQWCSAYQIGQRMLDRFVIPDSGGMGRIFFAGDACHTHSPKAGQGMNISMMDAYNLSWKLAYTVMGLTPYSTNLQKSNHILDTYHTERSFVAKELINFDRNYSNMFHGAAETVSSCTKGGRMSLSIFIDTHRRSNSFTSGCGVEYPESTVTNKTFCGGSKNPIIGAGPSDGALQAGRRLLNVRLKRYADGSHTDLHDDLSSNGRFTVLCLTSTDLLDPCGHSAKVLSHLGSVILPQFRISLVEQVVIYPGFQTKFDWNCIPGDVRYHSEMRFYNGSEIDDVYQIYGVDPAEGAFAVVRPDGYVGVVAELTNLQRVNLYLKACVATVT